VIKDFAADWLIGHGAELQGKAFVSHRCPPDHLHGHAQPLRVFFHVVPEQLPGNTKVGEIIDN
jgi:hypothetical protein